MGMYDEIIVEMRCPYCKEYQVFDAQTKDLDNVLDRYKALPNDWFSQKNRLTKIPFISEFPYDKSKNVWKNRAEYLKKRATIKPKYRKLKYVKVIINIIPSF